MEQLVAHSTKGVGYGLEGHRHSFRNARLLPLDDHLTPASVIQGQIPCPPHPPRPYLWLLRFREPPDIPLLAGGPQVIKDGPRLKIRL
jgi:hypothetical protein